MVARFLLALPLIAMTSSVSAGFLNIDFQNSTTATAGVTQTGFDSFTEVDGANPSGKTFSTSQGNVNLQVSGEDAAVGGFYTRDADLLSNSGAFTYADLYNDFIFKNSTTNQIDFVFLGLAHNQPYLVTFFSYDNSTAVGDGPTSHDISFTGFSGSAGTSALSYTSGVAPSTNNQYAVAAQFTTDGTGTLSIAASDVAFPRINGVELDIVIVPEPSSLAIASPLGMVLIFLRRRHSAGRACCPRPTIEIELANGLSEPAGLTTIPEGEWSCFNVSQAACFIDGRHAAARTSQRLQS